MDQIVSVINDVDAWIWGAPMIILLTCCHLFSTVRTGFIQLKLPKAIKLSVTADPDAEGDISQFGALCTALSGTLGVGCIVGVATAIISGGPGAIFWMWIMGILGMGTKYAETYIAVKFRVKDSKGTMCGGAMYVWQHAFRTKRKGQKEKKTTWWARVGAVCFASFTAIATLGTGCANQSKAITDSIYYYSSQFIPAIPQWAFALVVVIATALTIFGGVKGISKICEKLVPFMTVAFLAGAIFLLVVNYQFILSSLQMIIVCAFTPQAAFGGAVGSGIGAAMQFGIARGLFSNESGLGTAPIVASAAATKNPARQSLVAMTGAFWSTVVICLMTGVALLCSMQANPDLALLGTEQAGLLTLQAFEQIPYVGGPLLGIALAMFAFSTIIGWSYYADRSVTFLFGHKAVKPFLILYLIAAFVGGGNFGLDIWAVSDITNALMAIPNVLIVIFLSKLIGRETHHYVWENHLDEPSGDKIRVVDH